MLRAALIALVAGLALAPSAASAARPTLATAGVVLLACERDDTRAAEFEARMSLVPGATRMAMRFTLQASTPSKPRFRGVKAPGFGAWTTAEAGTTRYAYTRRVESLVAPAGYRVVVRFRWADDNGEIVSRSKSYSKVCRQPDQRPNLVIRSLQVEPTPDPAVDRYLALVRNTGTAFADPFELAVSGVEAPATVTFAPRRRDQLVEVLGPACEPGAEVTATADPADAVDERSERDNAFTVDC